MNATTKTVEQLKEELRVAQEAVAQVEREAQQKLRDAQRAAEREKEEAANDQRAIQVAPWLIAVAEALRAAGVANVTRRDWGIKIGTESYSDPDVQIGVEREEYPSGGSMYCRNTSYTERYILTVGDTYRDFPRVRYPSKKAGGFNVEKIVKTVTERIESKVAEVKRKQEKEGAVLTATLFAAQVSKELGFTDKYNNPISGTQAHSRQRGGRGSGYEYSTTEAPKGRVYYSVGTLTVTPAQAKILRDALVAIKALDKLGKIPAVKLGSEEQA